MQYPVAVQSSAVVAGTAHPSDNNTRCLLQSLWGSTSEQKGKKSCWNFKAVFVSSPEPKMEAGAEGGTLFQGLSWP